MAGQIGAVVFATVDPEREDELATAYQAVSRTTYPGLRAGASLRDS